MDTDHTAPLPAPPMALVEQWFRSHQPWLLERLRMRLRNTAEAEDLAGETFASVAGQAHGGTLGAVREPRAFLSTIAKRQLFQFWRRRDLERAWVEHLAVLPEEGLQGLQELEQAAAALDGLPPKALHAFLMSQLDGLTYREIGERLGVSASMVRQYMAQAHLRLAGLG